MKLTKQEIWKAYPALQRLGQVLLPVKTSLGLATTTSKLEPAYKVLSGESDKLVKKYGEEDEKTKQKAIKVGSPGMEKYLADLEKLLEGEWDEDFKFEVVKLPEMVAGTCDKCNHNLDVHFLIPAGVLEPLVGKFVN